MEIVILYGGFGEKLAGGQFCKFNAGMDWERKILQKHYRWWALDYGSF
jgi:hypothetical protein